MSEKRQLIVGLTGMSGAGKSTVCRVFRDSGFEVIDCDKCAREVAEPGMPALNELRDRLSGGLIRQDGSLDRQKTAEMIFTDPEKRALFNKIIYPYITYNITVKLRQAGEYVLLDAPTLFEARLELLCGAIVSVTASADNCIRRITARDGITTELAAARLKSQHGAEFYRERSDFCLVNDGTQEELFAQASGIAEKLKGIT